MCDETCKTHHLGQFQDHGTEAADVSVVPGVHHVQVGTESARLAVPFVSAVLKTETRQESKEKMEPDVSSWLSQESAA